MYVYMQPVQDKHETGRSMETKTTEASVPAVEQQRPQEHVPHPDEAKIMKVLVAVDGSEPSLYALRWALENYLCSFHGGGGGDEVREPAAMVTVVTVQPFFHPYVYGAGPDFFAYTQPELIESMRKAQEESAAAILSHALQLCKEKTIKAETLILKGDPKDMICQAAEEMHVDLLVVGSRGHGQIKRALLGSVSDYCSHHVECPILIVKPPKEESHK